MIDKKKVIEAYQETLGNVTQTCQESKISRQTFYNYLKDDPEFKAAIDAIEPEEQAIDFAENALQDKIKKGDTTAIIFFLKTKGKKRGYIEKQEVEHQGGIILNFDKDDAKL